MAMDYFQFIYLPYCLEKQEDGLFVVLNREYKPVGFNTNRYIKYGDYPVSVKIRLTKPTMKKLSYNGEGMRWDNKIYLYNGGLLSDPYELQQYFKRLALLVRLKASRY